jgi:hypothetical protein
VDENLGEGVEGDGDHSVVDVGQKAEWDRNNLWGLFVDCNDVFDRMMGGTWVADVEASDQCVALNWMNGPLSGTEMRNWTL